MDIHVEHSSDAIRTTCHIEVDGMRGLGRPNITHKKLMRTTYHSRQSTPMEGKPENDICYVCS